jgi:hypothetical protein
MLHGQSFDLGGLLLTMGFALGLGPCFATVVGLALGLSLSLLAAGSRGGSCLASGRRCSHARTPQKQERRRERQPCPEAMCGGVGRGTITVANGNHALPGRSHRVGVTSDGAENAPRLRVTYGEDSKESQPPLNADFHGARTCHTRDAWLRCFCGCAPSRCDIASAGCAPSGRLIWLLPRIAFPTPGRVSDALCRASGGLHALSP